MVELPVDKSGTYELRLTITRAQDYGRFKVGVEGAPTTSIDGAGPGYSRSNAIPCGKVRMHAGTNRVTFTVEGHGSASTGLYLGLDSIQLVPSN
ncbi:MAG: hypothetical protein ACHQ50_01235 [Fimbriimonadales bacterium]